jgi:hypothetical protein
MPESPIHKRVKGKAPGKVEVPIRGGRRLDSATPKTATEVERRPSGIPKAVSRLKSSGRPRKVIQVPQSLMPQAAAELRKQGISGTVTNLSRTKRRPVGKK